MDASGWCPCPAAQCPDPEAVKLLVLPHTMGANLYRVVDGTPVPSFFNGRLARCGRNKLRPSRGKAPHAGGAQLVAPTAR